MIQLIDADDVIKGKTRKTKNEENNINAIPLIGPDEVIDKSKALKLDKKEKNIIKESATKNKKYHLLRWKIKRFLIREDIKKCINWKTILDIFDSEILSKDDITDVEIKEFFYRYGSYIVDHHTKYKEIHGVDKTIWMTRGEHKQLHILLRKEGKCNIPPDQLAIIARDAESRTDKHKERTNRYYQTDRGKEINRKNQQNIKRKVFSKTLDHNVTIREQISYNIKTGTVTVSAGFAGGHGVKIPIIQID